MNAGIRAPGLSRRAQEDEAQSRHAGARFRGAGAVPRHGPSAGTPGARQYCEVSSGQPARTRTPPRPSSQGAAVEEGDRIRGRSPPRRGPHRPTRSPGTNGDSRRARNLAQRRAARGARALMADYLHLAPVRRRGGGERGARDAERGIMARRGAMELHRPRPARRAIATPPEPSGPRRAGCTPGRRGCPWPASSSARRGDELRGSLHLARSPRGPTIFRLCGMADEVPRRNAALRDAGGGAEEGSRCSIATSRRPETDGGGARRSGCAGACWFFVGGRARSGDGGAPDMVRGGTSR